MSRRNLEFFACHRKCLRVSCLKIYSADLYHYQDWTSIFPSLIHSIITFSIYYLCNFCITKYHVYTNLKRCWANLYCLKINSDWYVFPSILKTRLATRNKKNMKLCGFHRCHKGCIILCVIETIVPRLTRPLDTVFFFTYCPN